MAALTLLAAALVAQAYSGHLGDPDPVVPAAAPAAPAFPEQDVRPFVEPAPPPQAEAKVTAPRAADPAPAPAPAPTPAAGSSPYDLMNAERKRCGAPALVRDGRLDRVAADRLAQLAANGYSHTLKDGSNPLPALCARHGFAGPVTEGLVIGGSEPAGLVTSGQAARESKFLLPSHTHHSDLVDLAWVRVGFAAGKSGSALCSVTVYGREAPAPAPGHAKPARLISEVSSSDPAPAMPSAQSPAPAPTPTYTTTPAPVYYYTFPQAPQYQPYYYPIQPQVYGFGGGGCANGMCGGGFR